jgi:hypothetical protein
MFDCKLNVRAVAQKSGQPIRVCVQAGRVSAAVLSTADRSLEGEPGRGQPKSEASQKKMPCDSPPPPAQADPSPSRLALLRCADRAAQPDSVSD